MSILFVNNKNENCGVYQYGKRFFYLASEIFGTDIGCLETNAPIDPQSILGFDIVIANWHNATMNWLGKDFIDVLHRNNKKFIIIPHNKNFHHFHTCDAILYDDATFESTGIEFGLCRTIFDFDEKFDVDDKTIGFFGFSFPHKNLLGLIENIVSEFKDESPLLRLHCLPYNRDSSVYLEKCLNFAQDNKIRVELSEEILSELNLIRWCAKNSINVFPYLQPNEWNSQTATCDFAISARRPICVSKATMFSHLNSIESICLENNGLKDIIKLGIKPFEHLYKLWSVNNYKETILNAIKFVKR